MSTNFRYFYHAKSGCLGKIQEDDPDVDYYEMVPEIDEITREEFLRLSNSSKEA